MFSAEKLYLSTIFKVFLMYQMASNPHQTKMHLIDFFIFETFVGFRQMKENTFSVNDGKDVSKVRIVYLLFHNILFNLMIAIGTVHAVLKFSSTCTESNITLYCSHKAIYYRTQLIRNFGPPVHRIYDVIHLFIQRRTHKL